MREPRWIGGGMYRALDHVAAQGGADTRLQIVRAIVTPNSLSHGYHVITSCLNAGLLAVSTDHPFTKERGVPEVIVITPAGETAREARGQEPERIRPIHYNPKSIADHLAQRCTEGGLSATAVARTAAQFYFAIIEHDLDTVCLTLEDARFCRAAQSTLVARPGDEGTLCHDAIVDAICRALELEPSTSQCGVDDDLLRHEVKRWSPGQCYAVLDAVHRSMLLTDSPPSLDVDTALLTVGLVHAPATDDTAAT